MAMLNCLQSWPEPVVRVQSLSDSGIRVIPERYVKSPSDRPRYNTTAESSSPAAAVSDDDSEQIPVIDLQNFFSGDAALREATLAQISSACRDWGFFQVVNHGVSPDLMKLTREAWRGFFHLPVEVKQQYANSPSTYEGYGSRLGVEKGAKLDWSDYFFLHFLPTSHRDQNLWPHLPASCRELVSKYNEELVKLCGNLMKILSLSLGLKEGYLQEAFGGDQQVGACLRINFYPKCPQPDLTLGLSSHSDPGGLTLLLPDENVSGLQVRRANSWITVKPVPNAFIVNIGDQIQVLSNAEFKSVEHRVIVNSDKERLSLAFFYNPRADIPIKPAPELVTLDRPSLFSTIMTFNQYRAFIRTKGPCGKSHLEILKSPR